jgi:hypothetical protein
MLLGPLRHGHAIAVVSFHSDRQCAHASVDQPRRMGVDRLTPQTHQAYDLFDE